MFLHKKEAELDAFFQRVQCDASFHPDLKRSIREYLVVRLNSSQKRAKSQQKMFAKAEAGTSSQGPSSSRIEGKAPTQSTVETTALQMSIDKAERTLTKYIVPLDWKDMAIEALDFSSTQAIENTWLAVLKACTNAKNVQQLYSAWPPMMITAGHLLAVLTV